jgi:hypothetical protein
LFRWIILEKGLKDIVILSDLKDMLGLSSNEWIRGSSSKICIAEMSADVLRLIECCSGEQQNAELVLIPIFICLEFVIFVLKAFF